MIEVLKQALTDAKRNERHNNVAETRYWLNQYKLIAEQAIKELERQDDSYCQACDGALCTAKKGCVALSNPPQRKPLTDEECDDLWDMQVIHITDKVSAKQFIRDIEAAHSIKE